MCVGLRRWFGCDCCNPVTKSEILTEIEQQRHCTDITFVIALASAIIIQISMLIYSAQNGGSVEWYVCSTMC